MEIPATMALLHERLGPLLEGEDAIAPLPNADIMVRVSAAGLVAAAAILKEDLGFTTLMNHLGVDYGDSMAVIYNLHAPRLARKVTLKVRLDRSAPGVPTLGTVFPGSGWFERESFDLLGIVFYGHRNLRRLLLPEDWVGHPLRKDYVFPERYGGIDMRRPDPLAPSGAAAEASGG